MPPRIKKEDNGKMFKAIFHIQLDYVFYGNYHPQSSPLPPGEIVLSFNLNLFSLVDQVLDSELQLPISPSVLIKYANVFTKDHLVLQVFPMHTVPLCYLFL